MREIKIVHIIIGLNRGGAEMMLARMIECHSNSKGAYRHTVISLTNVGYCGEILKSAGISVYSMGAHKFIDFFSIFISLVKLLKNLQPDIVHTWMYHADFIGGIAAKICHIPVIWGIHSHQLNYGTSLMTRFLRMLLAGLSGFIPSKILCVSEASRTEHARIGYSMKNFVILSNGFNISALYSVADRISIRAALGVGESEFLIGIVGRFNPVKDHFNFIKAASLILNSGLPVRFLMVGSGVDPSNAKLMDYLHECNVDLSRFIMLGERSDVPKLLHALDIFCSSSRSEAFPLVVGEAMLMARVCVATNVGDTARLIGNTGIIVPPHDCKAFAGGIFRLLEMKVEERKCMGERARRRIIEEFSIEKYICNLELIYKSVLCDFE